MLIADPGLVVLAAGMLAALGLAVASATLWRSGRTLRERHLRGDIDATKARVDAMRRQLADGQITQQAFDEQQHGVAAGLLEKTAEAAAPLPRPALPRSLALAALAIAVTAGAAYLWLGRSGPMPASKPATPVEGAASEPVRAAHALTDEQLQRMVDQTRAQVQKNPKDTAAWAMLAHSYDMMGKFAESSKAYASLSALVPNDAQVLADYADALGVANGRTLKGEPSALITKALSIDGKNVKALTLAGTAAYEREDYAEAVARWTLARTLSKDPAFIQQIDASLASATASAKGLPLKEPARPVAPPGAASAVVSGRLTLADDLLAKATPDETVFIFARPVTGSRMPVAILRRHVRDLPLDFSLDDTMSMVPDARLSTVPAVIVGARISKRGDVAPQPGDMQGLTAPLPVGTRGIKLEIGEVLK
jgi:cytochrome c-type biogenesis protein CcmH